VRPDSLPPGDHYAHGTRARYVAGCRCGACRRANTAYEKERASARARGDWNGLVDAGPVRAHLRALSREGVGYKSVAAATDVAPSTLTKILAGERRFIRQVAARRVLAVDVGAAADHACIDARPTWRLIRDMLRLGLTRGEIAQRLGRKRAALQIGKRLVFARTALEVRRLHERVACEFAEERALARICTECGSSHAPEDRQAVVRRMLPCSAEDLREAHPCWWAGGAAGDRMLWRDLHTAGAAHADGTWSLPP